MPGGISGTGDVFMASGGVFMASGDVFMARSMFPERRCGAATLEINGCCMAGALERARWRGKTLPVGAKEHSQIHLEDSYLFCHVLSFIQRSRNGLYKKGRGRDAGKKNKQPFRRERQAERHIFCC